MNKYFFYMNNYMIFLKYFFLQKINLILFKLIKYVIKSLIKIWFLVKYDGKNNLSFYILN